MKRQEAKEKTRQKILEAALEEFTRQGYRGANTARIARAAGVAHGTVFLHFPDKDQLLFEVIRQRLVKISNRLYDAALQNETALQSEAAHESKEIESLCRVYLDHLNENTAFESMLAREMPNLPTVLKRQVFTIRSGIILHFHQAIQRGINEGKLKDVNPTVALHVWFGTLHYYLANQEMLAAPGEIINEKGNQLIDYFLTTLRS